MNDLCCHVFGWIYLDTHVLYCFVMLMDVCLRERRVEKGCEVVPGVNLESDIWRH